MDFIQIFLRLNEECAKTGESVIPLTNVRYYAEQIFNMTGETDYEAALAIAATMSNQQRR